MYFKKLEIVGFKSFAEKVILKFEPGLTAVVGPNGCGKSNIFDSIRWALGEQSIKSLRGSKMEDVIFNGTEKIPALGLAEVSITFSNETKILPIDYEEVTITRRLYRSGESEYLLNNNPVRLKDINELLMGTGIGAESYSLVEQGKIDLVLSSKPEDRRLVFDEATGVSKYKAKKKEAIRRLEDTENNLLRVNDIIQEVKRQIGSIERQASKARRYKEIFDKLKDLEIVLARYERNIHTTELEELKKADNEYREAVIKEEKNQQLLNAQLETIQKEIEALNKEMLQLSNDLIQNQNLSERKFELIKINGERIQELSKRIETISASQHILSTRLSQERERFAHIQQEFENDKLHSKEKAHLVSEKETTLKTIQSSIQQAHQRIKEANSKQFDIATNRTKLNNELIDIGSSLSGLSARKQRLQTELLKTNEEKESQERELQEIKACTDALRTQLNEKKQNAQTLKESHHKLENSIGALNEELRKLNDTLISLQSQKEFLQQLKLKYDDMPSAKESELIIYDMEKLEEGTISGIIAKATSIRYDEQKRTYHINCEAKLFSLDINRLEESIANIQNKIQAKTSEKQTLENNAGKLKEQISAIDDVLQKQHLELADKEAMVRNQQANFQKICDEISLHEMDIDEVLQSIMQRENRKTIALKELEALDQESARLETILTTTQTETQENNQKREQLLLEITELKTELNAIQTKERDTAERLAALERSLKEDTQSLESQIQEKNECSQKIIELKEETQKSKIEIGRLNEQRAEIQANEAIKNEEQDKRNRLFEELNTEKQKLILHISNLKDHSHQHELRMQECIFKLNQIKERLQQVYQCNLEELPPSIENEGFDINATKAEIEHLRSKVDTFGTVNLVAIEELDELKSRHDFLQQQQNDLNEAKNSLHEAILKINRTTRKMFLDTFHAVAIEFKNYFRLLFGGGDAEIFLIDESNVLESGIEIVCRPPGKKLQNILLLSGGEKSLSAIALIFAIFKTKPAPFCILDEIDAALDESNVDRFSRMLKEFTNTSQFICITHNKKTIVHANVMYGITMEQSGMSKIVSVKLSETETRQNTKEESLKSEKKTPLTPTQSP